jgi:hypothetical protein
MQPGQFLPQDQHSQNHCNERVHTCGGRYG